MAQSDSLEEEVDLGKERFIPVSKDRFLSQLISAQNDKAFAGFSQLCGAIEAYFNAQRLAEAQEMKRCYSCFSRRNQAAAEAERQSYTTEELQTLQNGLLKSIFKILKDSNFSPVTLQLYTNALQSIYLSDLPILVDWASLDSHLLSNFFDKNPYMDPYAGAAPPPFSRHWILFYRGIGDNLKTDLFIDHKINLITADISRNLKLFVVKHASTIYHALCGTLFASDTVDPPANKTDPDKQHVPKKDDKSLHAKRISLVHTYNTAKAQGFKSVVWWLLSNVTLREPTLRRLFIVYRSFEESLLEKKLRRAKAQLLKEGMKMSKRVTKLSKKISEKIGKSAASVEAAVNEPLLTTEDDEKAEAISSSAESQRKTIYNEMHRRCNTDQTPPINPTKQASFDIPIRVQYFADVPLADLEIVFPCKRLSLTAVDKLYLLVLCVLGVWATAKELFSDTSGWWALILLIGIGVLLVRALAWYRSKEVLYHATLNETLFDANIGSDKNALLDLLDSVQEQELMETIIAYYIVLKHTKDGNTIDMATADKLCEEYLRDTFGEKTIDMEIRDAFEKLLDLGIIEAESSDDENVESSVPMPTDDGSDWAKRYRAKSVLEAINCMERQWMSFPQNFRRIGSIPQSIAEETSIAAFDDTEADTTQPTAENSSDVDDGDSNGGFAQISVDSNSGDTPDQIASTDV